MLEVNGMKKQLKKRICGNVSPHSRPMSHLEGYNYSFYDPDYCWEPFFKYFVDEKHSKNSQLTAPPTKVYTRPSRPIRTKSYCLRYRPTIGILLLWRGRANGDEIQRQLSEARGGGGRKSKGLARGREEE